MKCENYHAKPISNITNQSQIHVGTRAGLFLKSAWLLPGFFPKTPVPRQPSHPLIVYDMEMALSDSFRTENGIAAAEQGTSYPGAEPETGSYVKEGSYEYQTDDGNVIVVSYVADEKGFEVLNPDALSAVLPTAPPTQYPPPLVPGAGLPVPDPLPEFNQRTTFLQ